MEERRYSTLSKWVEKVALLLLASLVEKQMDILQIGIPITALAIGLMLWGLAAYQEKKPVSGLAIPHSWPNLAVELTGHRTRFWTKL